MKEIDLGATRPEKEAAVGLSVPHSEPEVVYPKFHYEGAKELELPEHGEMTIHYKKVDEVSRVTNGQHFYTCTIEVRKILKVKGEDVKAPASSGSEAGDALDRLAQAEYGEEEGEE